MGKSSLPEDCIAHIISFTTPKDACRSCVLSKIFQRAADSNHVWGKFLPPEFHNLLPHLSKKELYFHLCDHPQLMGDDNSLSLSLDRRSGRKSWMISARGLSIAQKDNPTYWRWIPTAEFRFPEVAELLYIRCLDIIGRIETNLLSPQTNYASYLIFKFVAFTSIRGFRKKQVTLRVVLEGNMENKEQKLYLVSPGAKQQPYRERGDGWMEIKVGEFYNNYGDDGTLVCNFKQIDSYTTKAGLIVGGIELRPV